MANRPGLIKLLVVMQGLVGIYTLFLPFLSGSFISYTSTDFLMSYFFALLDFILMIGFWTGAKWSWLFGLLFNAFNIVNYVFMYLSTPLLWFVIPLLMRLIILLGLRSRKMREFFDFRTLRL